jgi:pectate disaccharide-lyase
MLINAFKFSGTYLFWILSFAYEQEIIMKKTFYFFPSLILFLLLTNNSFAQYTATWTLLSASGNNVTVTGVQAANVSASAMIPGSAFASGTHNSDGFKCTYTTAWPTVPTDGMQLDFPLSPVTGNNLFVTGLTLTAKTSGSSGSNILSIAYQMDGTGAWTTLGSPLEAPSGGTTNLSLGTVSAQFIDGHTYVLRIYAYAKGTGTTSSRNLYIKNVVFSGTTESSNTPKINLSVSSLTSFGNVQAGSISDVKSYTVSGTRLTDNILISAQQGFQMSTDSSNFSGTITLVQTGGEVSSTKIYVRFAPATPGGKLTGTITHSSSGALTKDLAVEGVALYNEPTISSNVSFGTITGNSIVVNVSGGNGKSRIIVAHADTPVSWAPVDGTSIIGESEDFSAATDQGNGNKVVFNLPDSVSRTVTVTGLDVATTYYFTVYEYNGSAGSENYLTVSPGSGNATTLTVAEIFATPTLIKFGNVLIGTTSAEKTYSLSAKYLTPDAGSITVNCPAYFEISTTSGSGFGSSLTIPYSSGTLSAINIYIRFNPTSIFDYAGIISNSGGGASSVSVSVSGFGRDSSSFITKAIYVSPDGNDVTGTGSIDKPYRTVYNGGLKLTNGYTLVLRGGLYYQDSLVLRDKNLTNIAVINYPGEHPIINGSAGYDIIILYCNNSLIKGIEVTKAVHNAILILGHNNRIEFCQFHDGGDSGLKIGSHYETAFPRNNLVINCDSYRNYDTRGNGGNADGFSAKWNIGSGNRFVGCRSWENSDDGWDLWQADSTVIMDSCWCFRNGHDVFNVGSAGNGNGFKIGGAPVCVPHIMRNCISFDNSGASGGKGFDQNSNFAGHTILNCISFGNSYLDFNFYKPSTNGTLVAKNNIQFRGTTSPYIKFVDGDVENNSWKAFTWQTGYTWAGFTVTDNDFQSVDTTLALAPRQADGSLTNTFLLRLKGTSQLINKGLDVGIPYAGSAPDLGPFEYIQTNLSLTALIQGFTNSVTGQMIPDTVACVIKNDIAPFPTVDSVKVSLNVNGQGTATYYQLSLNKNYYIQIKHRNALETWSNPVAFTNSTPSYDFTTSPSQAYGNNLIQVGSKWCIYSGDVNHDGLVDLSDLIAIDNDNANYVTGHVITDITGDGLVDLSDLVITDNNNALYVNKILPAGADRTTVKSNYRINNGSK